MLTLARKKGGILHHLVWWPSISPWTDVPFPNSLQLVQWEVAFILEAAKLIHADIALCVPPGFLAGSRVRSAQSNLYVLASYIGKGDQSHLHFVLYQHSHLLDMYMANAGHDHTLVTTFFPLTSGVPALRVISRNEVGMLIFRARYKVMKAARVSLNFHWRL